MEPYYFCGTAEAVADVISPWRKQLLVWQIAGNLPGLSRDDFRSAAAQAFASWQSVCGLTFKEAGLNETPDILMTAGRIDRQGGVLAWSELPDGSDRQLLQKYDTSEAYVIAIRPPTSKIDLVAVCCHEIGHALGLDHAANGSPDLMAPIYDPGRRTPQTGDIQRIQGLYPVRTTPPPPVPGEPITIQIYGADRIIIPGYKVEKI
jgi:hypothetical protein